RRLVVSVEARESGKFDEDLINGITGGERIATRTLYEKTFEFQPQCTIWLAANNQPRIGSMDGAIWRRMTLLPFDQAIPEEQWDRTLKDRLQHQAEHQQAILAWMVRGC